MRHAGSIIHRFYKVKKKLHSANILYGFSEFLEKWLIGATVGEG
jgi:hypothetical protein